MSEPTPATAPATSPEPARTPVAWQPFTPKGIAAFAAARYGRLFLLQVIVALIAAGAVVWFLRTVWFPPVRESIRNLPEAGALWGRQLEISDFPAERLVTNRFVSF